MTNYSFSAINDYSKSGIKTALEKLNKQKKKPIVVCVGSDLVLGDSLGPLIGTMLRKNNVSSYVYGTLNYPVTAKEVEYASVYLKKMHPDSIIIAIDAAVGEEEDVGLIRILNKGLKPGLGVQKNLASIGDVSIIGVVAPKSIKNYTLFNMTRLNLVYKMAETISESLTDYLSSFSGNNTLEKLSLNGIKDGFVNGASTIYN